MTEDGRTNSIAKAKDAREHVRGPHGHVLASLQVPHHILVPHKSQLTMELLSLRSLRDASE